MTAIIFAGPTLSEDECKNRSGFTFLPPAMQGDVYRAAQESPPAIGLIDGMFENVPAVWHKEILWALAGGVPVFGAASMGALRAAELHAFGMIGLGTIYQEYRDGRIEDDDEVAVLHGPAELDYLPLTEAMVNVRATIGYAADAQIVAAAAAAAIVGIAKATFYKERTWPKLLADAEVAGVSHADIARLRAWLPSGAVDRKRDDARLMLDGIENFIRAGAPPVRPAFTFRHTRDWQRVVAEHGR